MKAADRQWGLTDALELVNLVRHDLADEGWCIGLTGSVLFRGASLNDLDIILFPLDASDPGTDKDDARRVLNQNGLVHEHTVIEVHEKWRKKDSQDTKHVEIWMKDRRRIDVFFLS